MLPAAPVATRPSARLTGESGLSAVRVPAIDVAIGAALALLTLVVRVVWAAARPTDWDSVQFVEGMKHFDVTHGSPHPPGYFLYEVAGRLVMAVSGLDATTSLVLVAATTSAAASAATYAAARQFCGRALSVGAVLLVASAPVAWYAGSMVNTYSFDALGSALLLLLACRARPGSMHGALALAALAVLAGFRQSLLETLALLALVAVVASVRTLRGLVVALAAGLGGLCAWIIPLAAEQPGGLAAWWRATRLESGGAYRTSSLLFANHGAGLINFGILAAYASLMLWTVTILALIGVAVLVLTYRRRPPGDQSPAWYQSWFALFVASVVPPLAVFSLVEFGKGGYALAFVPAATVLLLAPLDSALRRGRSGPYRPILATLSAVVIAIAVAFNVDRFTEGGGIIPTSLPAHAPGLWLMQARYGAPYPETYHTISVSDRADRQLQTLSTHLRPGDILIYTASQPGAVSFRNLGWALPEVQEAYLSDGDIAYEQFGGTLYYTEGPALAVSSTQRVYLLVSAPTPELQSLLATGRAVRLGWQAAGWQVWSVVPGVAISGVSVEETATPPPLRGGIARPAPAS